MKYDSKQIEMELMALRHNRDITKENFHKICGAIELAEAMHKNALEQEAKEAEEAKANEASEEAVADAAPEAD